MAVITQIRGQQIQAFGFETITVAAAAGGIGPTLATINPATKGYACRGVFTVETAQIRYRYDGTAPSSTVGHILNAGDVLELEGIINLQNLLFIRTTGSSATVQATYERVPQGL